MKFDETGDADSHQSAKDIAVFFLILYMYINMNSQSDDLDLANIDEVITLAINIVSTTVMKSIIKQSCDCLLAKLFKKGGEVETAVAGADNNPFGHGKNRLVSRL